MGEVAVQVSKYTVSAIPLDDPHGYPWWISVELRGDDQWAVAAMGRVFCRTDGRRREPEGAWDRNPSSRTEGHLKTYRLPLDEALELAKRIAVRLVINGKTASEYLEWRAARQAQREVALDG